MRRAERCSDGAVWQNYARGRVCGEVGRRRGKREEEKRTGEEEEARSLRPLGNQHDVCLNARPIGLCRLQFASLRALK